LSELSEVLLYIRYEFITPVEGHYPMPTQAGFFQKIIIRLPRLIDHAIVTFNVIFKFFKPCSEVDFLNDKSRLHVPLPLKSGTSFIMKL